MDDFTFLLARLVPQALVFALVLVTARFLHDRIMGLSPLVARTVFFGVLVAGFFAAIPSLTSSWLLFRGQRAYGAGNWREVTERFDEYAQLHGTLTTKTTIRRATALMNLRQWQRAESVLRSITSEPTRGVVRGPTRAVELLPVCWYHLGYRAAAERAFLSLANSSGPDTAGSRTVTFYYLGCLAAGRGDWEQAVTWFGQCLQREPLFFPAAYNAARALTETGRTEDAIALLGRFVPKDRPAGEESELAAWLEALRRPGFRLPEQEFVLAVF